MAQLTFNSPVDRTIFDSWNGSITGSTSTVITYAGPVYSANFIGSFTPSGASVTGTLNSFSQFKNGQLQYQITGLSSNAATVASEILANQSSFLRTFLDRVLSGEDNVVGSSGNDFVAGFNNSDTINGGAGVDSAVYFGTGSQYTLQNWNRDTGNLTVRSLVTFEGSDNLTSIERLVFSDGALALDFKGNAGQAFRLYQAAFNRKPDMGGVGFQMNELDNGASLKSIALNFINSPEFASTYGNVDNTGFVSLLYANVLHRTPDSGGLAFHTGNLASGANSRADVLVGFSESPENQAALIGTISSGISYTPV